MAKMIPCPDCDGTGARNPNCWVCKGMRSPRWRRCVALGFPKTDLDEIEDDGYCRCPSMECHGDSCDLCMGDGQVSSDVPETEVTRVLIFGLTQVLPNRYRLSSYGRWLHDDGYLSTSAGAECQKRGWITRHNSIFGHEVYLTDAGRIEAERRIGGWHALHDCTLRHIDDDGRMADDGCRLEAQD